MSVAHCRVCSAPLDTDRTCPDGCSQPSKEATVGRHTVTITTEVPVSTSLAKEMLENLQPGHRFNVLRDAARWDSGLTYALNMLYIGASEYLLRVHGDPGVGDATVLGQAAEDATDDVVATLGDILPLEVLERCVLRAKGQDRTSPEMDD